MRLTHEAHVMPSTGNRTPAAISVAISCHSYIDGT
jgi:hypothetical protein